MAKPVSFDDVADRLEAYLRERFLIRSTDRRFNRTTNLWDDGYVDSLGLVELIGFIETTFEIKLPEDALFDESRRSVNGMAQMIVEFVSR